MLIITPPDCITPAGVQLQVVLLQIAGLLDTPPASQLNKVAKISAEEANQELKAISCAITSVVYMV
jgi:hypothetical protein